MTWFKASLILDSFHWLQMVSEKSLLKVEEIFFNPKPIIFKYKARNSNCMLYWYACWMYLCFKVIELLVLFSFMTTCQSPSVRDDYPNAEASCHWNALGYPEYLHGVDSMT